MTKEKFCKIMEELYEGERLQQEVAEAVRQYNNVTHNDFPEPFGLVVTHDFVVMDLLAEIMDDKNGDIDYFCMELDYGTKYNQGDVVDEDGTEIDFSTSERLYDYLEGKRNTKG